MSVFDSPSPVLHCSYSWLGFVLGTPNSDSEVMMVVGTFGFDGSPPRTLVLSNDVLHEFGPKILRSWVEMVDGRSWSLVTGNGWVKSPEK
ncbi:hypothetical protein ACFX2I_029771 [Malus domestica]